MILIQIWITRIIPIVPSYLSHPNWTSYMFDCIYTTPHHLLTRWSSNCGRAGDYVRTPWPQTWRALLPVRRALLAPALVAPLSIMDMAVSMGALPPALGSLPCTPPPRHQVPAQVVEVEKRPTWPPPPLRHLHLLGAGCLPPPPSSSSRRSRSTRINWRSTAAWCSHQPRPLEV